MADPITWGLLNLIKKRVKGVQTTLDGVSDQVSGLPDSLNTDFTEVKEAVAGVKTDVSDAKVKIEVLESEVDKISNLSANILSVVNDILLGKNITEWITDLETNGTSSETYKNTERMSALIESQESVLNTNISKTLCDWAISNNKTGVYFKTLVGDISNKTWDSLTTADQVTGNSYCFNKIANNKNAFNYSMDNSTMKSAIFKNWEVTESCIQGSSVAISRLSNAADSYILKNDSGITPIVKNCFLVSYAPVFSNSLYVTGKTSITYKRPNGESVTTPEVLAKDNQYTAVNAFASAITDGTLADVQGSTSYERIAVKYIEF